jgi:hypothetical protein
MAELSFPHPDLSMSNVDNHVILNGVDGVTGEYLVPPLALSEAAAMLLDPAIADPLQPLGKRMERLAAVLTQPHLGLPHDVRPERIEEAGWGVVFHGSETEAIKTALAPLIAWRQSQAGERFHVLNYHTGETWSGWLARHRVAGGTIDPRRVPYYLLIVGDPALIPFEFCHQLDMEYAVGRLHFDTPEEYVRYAGSVVAYEKGEAKPRAREVAYFGPRHNFDRATQLSADHLIGPLAFGFPPEEGVPPVAAEADKAGYRTNALIGADATKQALRDLLLADGRPGAAVLFSASHGMGWPLGDSRQRPNTGALLCQDWPGVGSIAPAHYFSAGDLPDNAQVGGLVAIHFACYSAGTPEWDRFVHKPGQAPGRVAARPFIAALPQRMLCHPQGGALACIGHVERAWGYSISPPRAGPQILPFQNLLGRILHGQPVGHAMKDINERFAVLAAALSSKLEYASYGRKYPVEELVADWIQRNDAEGYLLIGDPAVALRVGDLE